MRRPILCALLLAALGPSADARAFPVGVTTLTFTKTSVTTGAPRPLATVVWYPAAARTGSPEALGLRDAADTVEMIHEESLVPVSRAAARLVAWTAGRTAAGLRTEVID